MAASSRIVTLNLGSQTVGLAEFRTRRDGGLVLNGYRLREILGEPGNEVARNGQITAALQEIMGELEIKSGAVNYCVAATALTRRKKRMLGVALRATKVRNNCLSACRPRSQRRRHVRVLRMGYNSAQKSSNMRAGEPTSHQPA